MAKSKKAEKEEPKTKSAAGKPSNTGYSGAPAPLQEYLKNAGVPQEAPPHTWPIPDDVTLRAMLPPAAVQLPPSVYELPYEQRIPAILTDFKKLGDIYTTGTPMDDFVFVPRTKTDVVKLTTEEEALAKDWLDWWAKVGLSCKPGNQECGDEGIRGIYELQDRDPPRMIRAGSPLVVTLAGPMIEQNLIVSHKAMDAFWATTEIKDLAGPLKEASGSSHAARYSRQKKVRIDGQWNRDPLFFRPYNDHGDLSNTSREHPRQLALDNRGDPIHWASCTTENRVPDSVDGVTFGKFVDGRGAEFRLLVEATGTRLHCGDKEKNAATQSALVRAQEFAAVKKRAQVRALFVTLCRVVGVENVREVLTTMAEMAKADNPLASQQRKSPIFDEPGIAPWLPADRQHELFEDFGDPDSPDAPKELAL